MKRKTALRRAVADPGPAPERAGVFTDDVARLLVVLNKLAAVRDWIHHLALSGAVNDDAACGAISQLYQAGTLLRDLRRPPGARPF